MNDTFALVDYLASCNVDAALIGGVALGAHGIARATLDTDVLVSQAEVLHEDFWRGASSIGAAEIRIGDADDPLLGVVRITAADAPIDIIVGRGAWIREILARRVSIHVGGRSLPVVDRADLVLLKLFAGGPQDLLDVRLILEASPPTLRDEIETRLPQVPNEARQAWTKLAAAV